MSSTGALSGKDRLPEVEPETLRAAFDLSPAPQVLVEEDGCVVLANAAFAELVAHDTASLQGTMLTDHLAGLAGSVPELAERNDPVAAVVQRLGGRAGVQSCAVRVAGAGERFLVSVQADAAGNRSLMDAALHRVKDQTRTQQALLDLSRRLTLGTNVPELVAVCSRTVAELVPGVRVCVRLLDPETRELESIHAVGTLRPDAREKICLRAATLRHVGLTAEAATGGALSLCDSYCPVFQGSETGLSVPLVSGEGILGVLNIEPAVGGAMPELDGSVVQTLANQLAVGIRDQRLYDHSEYLKGLLENLVESANALIVVMDRERRIFLFNRAAQQLTGFSSDEVKGRGFTELVVEEARGRVLPLIIDTMLGQSSASVETQLVDRQGNRHPVMFSTAPFHDADGKVGGVIAVGTDLTRIRALEGQVQHSSKLASLGQLAAGIVHELNNPLTSISVYGDHLLKQAASAGDDPGQVKRLTRIVDAAERIRGFCRDLLTYARPSDAEVVRIDLNRVIQEALSFCEHVLQASDVIVTRNLAADPAGIFGAREQLHQVFVNLSTNAAHAMHGCPVTELVVSTHTVEEHVEVTISDTGIGIEEEAVLKIFEPFFSTKGEGKGTGLGLSIVRELVQNHRGSITVRSKVGTGTSFTLRFPVAR